MSSRQPHPPRPDNDIHKKKKKSRHAPTHDAKRHLWPHPKLTKVCWYWSVRSSALSFTIAAISSLRHPDPRLSGVQVARWLICGGRGGRGEEGLGTSDCHHMCVCVTGFISWALPHDAKRRRRRGVCVRARMCVRACVSQMRESGWMSPRSSAGAVWLRNTASLLHSHRAAVSPVDLLDLMMFGFFFLFFFFCGGVISGCLDNDDLLSMFFFFFLILVFLKDPSVFSSWFESSLHWSKVMSNSQGWGWNMALSLSWRSLHFSTKKLINIQWHTQDVWGAGVEEKGAPSVCSGAPACRKSWYTYN